MTKEQQAFAAIADKLLEARLLDCSGCSVEDTQRANQIRHDAEELAREWALGEKTDKCQHDWVPHGDGTAEFCLMCYEVRRT